MNTQYPYPNVGELTFKDSPGEPGGIEDVEAECSCWPDGWWDNAEIGQMLEALVGAWQSFGYAAEAKEMEALYKEDSQS